MQCKDDRPLFSPPPWPSPSTSPFAQALTQGGWMGMCNMHMLLLGRGGCDRVDVLVASRGTDAEPVWWVWSPTDGVTSGAWDRALF